MTKPYDAVISVPQSMLTPTLKDKISYNLPLSSANPNSVAYPISIPNSNFASMSTQDYAKPNQSHIICTLSKSQPESLLSSSIGQTTTKAPHLHTSDRIVNPNLGQPPDIQIKKIYSKRPLSINNIVYPKPTITCDCNHNHFNHIIHEVTNFVDDSTSTIGIRNLNDIVPYIKDYLEVLAMFYDSNKLKLNKTKTKFNINGTKSQLNQTKNLSLVVNNEVLYNDSQITILGFKFNISNTLDSQINDLIQQINFRISCLNKVKQFTTFKTRKNFFNAFCVSKLRYMAPAYLSAPVYLTKKLNTTLVNIAKSTFGYKYHKMSHEKLIKECGWTNIDALIKIEALNFLHRIFYFKRPTVLFNLFKIPERKCKDISIREFKKSKLMDNIFIYKILPEYNKLPTESKQLKPKSFSRYLKRTI